MPPIIVTPSALSSNVGCLGERNSDLAEKLAAATPRDDLDLKDTAQGVPAVIVAGTPLCSRHRPLDEAQRLVDQIDLVEHAVVVVLGFGAGYHVQRLAERLDAAGVIIVLEPDIALLRSVLERVDHSAWLRDAKVVWITDPSDRGGLARKLEGAESIIAQGVAFLQHPASRSRLAESSKAFTTMFSEYVTAAKTTLTTTLMRSVDTVRNLLLNLDHYAAGAGIADLRNAAAGFPAVVVSAGPSLQRNVHLLAEDGVRERCVIIAAQTTLRPLVRLGVRPHFVTALDFHEISRRFYEGLEAGDVDGVTLIADPKAHPVILDAFPGPLRCCASGFLDGLLGDAQRPMGTLPAGATVAHLAAYVARFLGCDPIVMIGQDLAFSDGLYYAPGTAIAEVWAPELNPFNTIEMMEWQRIVRHRVHLTRVRDVWGRSVYTDTQMLTYLQQFERDFARYADEGVQVIDATEGGIAKQHTTRMPLAEALQEHAKRPLPPLPRADRRLDPERRQAARARVDSVRRDIAALRETSLKTAGVIRRMLDDQADPAKMNRHFEKIERYRTQVEERFEAFEILNHLNQLGVFKRFKADRRLHMRRDLDPRQRQRAQLERDLENVTWTADAAREMIGQLVLAERLLAGEPVAMRPGSALDPVETGSPPAAAPASRIAALVPVDPDRNGLGVARSLTEPWAGRPVLQATLERLGRSKTLESIILIAPRDFEVDAVIDRTRIGLPVEVERCDGSPYGREHPAIAAARRWSETCWRGGIAGMSVYDEVLCPSVMSRIMQRRKLTAGLLVGPDWPLVDVSAESGLDAVVARHLELPQHHSLVFSQAPPGLGGCLISAPLMEELSLRNRLSTVGGLLVYQPHAPQHDPIARSVNVQIDHRVGRSRTRATFDAPRHRRRLRESIEPRYGRVDLTPAEIVAALERQQQTAPDELPHHVILELCTDGRGGALIDPRQGDRVRRPPLPLNTAERLFGELAAAGDAVVTLGGCGDPLLHPQFDDIVRLAGDAGVCGVHVRTRLTGDRSRLDRLLACGLDVVSVDLHADRAETYRRLMGRDGFQEVLANINYLLAHRERLTDHGETAALGLPWIVPRLQRRTENYEDIEPFFDRWQAILGTAVIEGGPRCHPAPASTPASGVGLIGAATPPRVMIDEGRRRMTVYCDGSVPLSELDLAGKQPIGNVADAPLAALWHVLCERRRALAEELGDDAEPLRTLFP
ncbi:MAG: 6-hydroxymethylpterin diphosphokinase MptE-like protein [Planctomycetota bacterium]|jgi:hypothetical protein